MAFKITEICDMCKKEISETKDCVSPNLPVTILKQVVCKPKTWFVCDQCEIRISKMFEFKQPKKSKYPKGA